MVSLIIAIIKPHKLDDVKQALTDNGVSGITVTEVSGFGRQRGKTENFRGSEYTIEFLPKIKLEVIVPSDIADRLVEVIAEAGRTGKIGDGKIWKLEVASLMRIRTGEVDLEAV